MGKEPTVSFVIRAGFVLLAFAQLVPPVQAANTAEGDLGRRLDTYLTRVVPFGFSGAVLVSSQGKVILDCGYGMAVRSTGTPNTPETVFSTGSLTKQFTAAAILKLESMGRLNTDDTIDRFFDAVPADKKALTLHHLLTHTAGLPDASGFDFDEAQRDDTVRRILDMPLEFEPGTEMSYSNCGYSLLGAIVELASGQPYERFLKEQLFEPAGMEWTGYRLPDWDARTVAHNYVGDSDNGRHLDRAFPYWNLLGNGGILSTTDDMFLWYNALKGDAVLTADAKKKLWTPFLNEYAYGWDVIEMEDGTTKIRHDGGSMMGNSAVMTWLVEEDVLVVIFCNQSYGDSPLFEIIEEKVMAMVYGDTFPVPATRPVSAWAPPDLRRYVGSYELAGGGRVVAEVANGALQLTAIDQEAIDALLFPGSPADSHSGLNDRARALIEAAMTGDIAPFEAELGEGDRATRFQSAIQRQIRRVERMTEEKVTGVVIVGTVPFMADDVVATGLRYRTPLGERGRLSVMWRDGKLVGLDMLMFTPTVPFVPEPEAADALAGYHLVWGRTFAVNFRVEGGAVTGLDLGGGKIGKRTK
jgi:CubicO group peptidase (beta-lactamase class C family)